MVAIGQLSYRHLRAINIMRQRELRGSAVN